MVKTEVKTTQVGFRIADKQLTIVDNLIQLGLFKDRTDFFQHATTKLLINMFEGKEPIFEKKLEEWTRKAKIIKEIHKEIPSN